MWTIILLLIIAGYASGQGEYYVRVQGGEFYSEGRVEVYLDGAWGTVCGVGWDDDDATVLCRQIGYVLGGLSTHGSAHFGQGTGEVVIGDVSCRGSERSLGDCPKTTMPYCDESERNAGVVCNDGRMDDDRYTIGEVRLAGTDVYKWDTNAGTVKIYYNKRWNTVCNEGWDMTDAMVVCKQLGYPRAVKYKKNAAFEQGPGLVLTSRVACTGSETRLLDCPHSDLYATGCNHSQDATVKCEGTVEYGALRLVDGEIHSEGRLEIYYDGRWGSVCNVGWTQTAANVACRELGFKYAEVENGTFFGPGQGPIYLRELVCFESSERLINCGHYAWDNSFTCNHNDDVGIICHQGTLSAAAIVFIVLACLAGILLIICFIARCKH